MCTDIFKTFCIHFLLLEDQYVSHWHLAIRICTDDLSCQGGLRSLRSAVLSLGTTPPSGLDTNWIRLTMVTSGLGTGTGDSGVAVFWYWGTKLSRHLKMASRQSTSETSGSSFGWTKFTPIQYDAMMISPIKLIQKEKHADQATLMSHGKRTPLQSNLQSNTLFVTRSTLSRHMIGC